MHFKKCFLPNIKFYKYSNDSRYVLMLDIGMVTAFCYSIFSKLTDTSKVNKVNKNSLKGRQHQMKRKEIESEKKKVNYVMYENE